MKQTRKIFVLNGFSFAEEEILLKELNFKALTVFYKKDISLEELVTVFKHNKCALCISCNLPGNFFKKAIKVTNFKFDADIVNQFQKIASFNNCDIGDHKSNSSGLKGIPTIADCAYCNYIKGLSKEQHHKILYSSDNFFVMCTLGQFIYGYLLIIPYNHIMSNGELSVNEQQEFLTVLEDISYILKKTYNVPNVLVWENGTGNSGIGKAKDSVVHAHTHVAPSNLTAKEIEIISGFSFETIRFNQISKYCSDSYLLIHDSHSMWKICQDSNLYIPRQYVRQLLAEEYHIPGECWNWRTHPYFDKMCITDNQIISMLKGNWNKLPQRIKNRTKYHLF